MILTIAAFVIVIQFIIAVANLLGYLILIGFMGLCNIARDGAQARRERRAQMRNSSGGR